MRTHRCISVSLCVCLCLCCRYEAVTPCGESQHLCREVLAYKTVLLGWQGGYGSLCPALVHGFGSFADVQDDQVVEAVSRDKKRELPLEQILALTEETFHSALLEAARTVVLFYASCE